jgi:hypothetical protein
VVNVVRLGVRGVVEVNYLFNGFDNVLKAEYAVFTGVRDVEVEVIDFICEMLECYREELNCYANDRGGQTYSQQLIVTETLPDGDTAVVELGKLGTTAFQPKNRPQSLKLSSKKKIDFCLIVESEGTANTLVANGFTKRHNSILMAAKVAPDTVVKKIILAVPSASASIYERHRDELARTARADVFIVEARDVDGLATEVDA